MHVPIYRDPGCPWVKVLDLPEGTWKVHKTAHREKEGSLISASAIVMAAQRDNALGQWEALQTGTDHFLYNSYCTHKYPAN